MKLTRAEIAAMQRAERYRDAAKRAIDNDGSEAAVMNNLQAASDWYGAAAQMVATRKGKVTA